MARPSDPDIRIDLIAAAEELFSARGLDGTRVEDITEKARVSKGAFYLHFESKEVLFLQIVETLIARLRAALHKRVVREADVWTIPFLRQRWLERDLGVFEFIWQNRDIVRIVLEGGKSAASGHLMDEFSDGVRRVIAEFLGWAAENKLLRPGLDRELAAVMVAGVYDQLARALVKRGDRPDLIAWSRQAQEFVLTAISDPKVMNSRSSRWTRS
jgi:AcrR family transcriptional regulator